MTRPLRVGVSDRTFEELRLSPRPEIEFHSAQGDAQLQVVWRRQHDRTAWLVSLLESCPELRWVHTDTAGVDRLPLHVFLERNILLSNARGAYTPAVSEWVIGALLLAAKRLDSVVRSSDRRVWEEPPFRAIELSGRTVVVLGSGSIGTAVARFCSTVKMRVVGVSRRRKAAEPWFDVQRTAVDDAWLADLGDASFLVVSLPLTPATSKLVDERVLEALPRHAWLVNVGRGQVVDEAALVAAIEAGRLGGAVVDTVSNEPPAADDPLWGHENLIISSHGSSFTDRTPALTMDLFLSEAERFRAGDRLQNLIDLRRGY